MNSNDFNVNIFVLGTQRSGTTLLTRILNAHPQLFIQNEISVENIFTGYPDKQKILDNIDQQIYLRHHKPVEQLLSEGNIKQFGIKDPEFTDHLNALELFIPESKFILIIRDGRAVVNSYIENKWGLGTNAYSGALRWKDEVSRQVVFANTFPANVLTLRFEDLISDMDENLGKICSFLEIEFSNDMLDYYKRQPSFKPNKSNINTNKAPDITLAMKWLGKLSQNEINIIETVAGDELRKFDYESRGRKISVGKIQKLYYEAHQSIIGELQLQFQLKKHKIKTFLTKRPSKNNA